MTDVRSYRVLVIIDGQPSDCAAIEYEGQIWLVPTWLSTPDGKFAKPERMIPLASVPHQKIDPPMTTGPYAGVDFCVNISLPKVLFDGKLTPELKRSFSVREKPDAVFRSAQGKPH